MIDWIRNIITCALVLALWYFDSWYLGVFALHVWLALELFVRKYREQVAINNKIHEAMLQLQKQIDFLRGKV